MANETDLQYKCLRHRLKPQKGKCTLCEAKREAKGNIDKTRRIYVLKKK